MFLKWLNSQRIAASLFNRKPVTVLLLIVLFCAGAAAQADPAANTNSNTAPSPLPTPTPIPVASVLSEAEAATARLKNIRASLEDTSAVAPIDNGLPALRQDIDTREAEARRILSENPSFDDLRSVEQDWNPFQTLARWTRRCATAHRPEKRSLPNCHNG